MAAPFEWLAGWEQPLVTDQPLRVVGIDLGTTNSTITEIVWEPGSNVKPLPEVITVEQETLQGVFNGDVVPSVVAVLGDRVLVGEGAHRLRGASEPHLDRNRALFWETKNEIGTRRTYGLAPEGFASPQDIASQILRFLNRAAEDSVPQPIDRVVITVPASFQWEQRMATFRAAELAGLDVQPGELLDEPIAAFLDYLAIHGRATALGNRASSRVLVFDFGGGTCDIAVLRVRADTGDAAGMSVARLGVSRFHRIGGSDIDDAIAADVLLPELMRQNGKDPKKVTFTQKRDFILPALQGIAASLKVKLSGEMRRRQKLGNFDPNDRTMEVSLPGAMPIPFRRLGDGEVETFNLKEPKLTLPQLMGALRPFLSSGVVAPRDSEYTHAQSVFAPVSDVLARCGLAPEDIDACLLVGGSSLFPPLVAAVESYLPSAAILTYKEPRDALRCVGRGAAFHALLMAAYGTSPLAPTTGDSVSIRTRQGLENLVPRNKELPFPVGGGWATTDSLRMSAGDGLSPQELLLHLVSGDEELDARTLAIEPVEVAPPVREGDPITLRTRVDANQRLEMRAVVTTSAGEQEFELKLDNPFSVTINPNATRERIMELEEQMKSGMDQAGQIRALRRLAGWHAELGERERARDYYTKILPLLPLNQQAGLCNTLGILCGEIGDVEAQQEYYRRAAELGGGTGPMFNLALSLRKQRQHEAALKIVNELLTREDSVEHHALRGLILADMGRRDEASPAHSAAVDLVGDLRRRSDFELGWAAIAARGADRKDLVENIGKEQRRRAEAAGRQGGTTGDSVGSEGDNLPKKG